MDTAIMAVESILSSQRVPLFLKEWSRTRYARCLEIIPGSGTAIIEYSTRIGDFVARLGDTPLGTGSGWTRGNANSTEYNCYLATGLITSHPCSTCGSVYGSCVQMRDGNDALQLPPFASPCFGLSQPVRNA